jgi:hypothetical protein
MIFLKKFKIGFVVFLSILLVFLSKSYAVVVDQKNKKINLDKTTVEDPNGLHGSLDSENTKGVFQASSKLKSLRATKTS